MTFETEQDLMRERKAIETFVKVFGGSFTKLGPNDIDYKIFGKDGVLIAYAEVTSRFKNISIAYPLPVQLSKLNKLIEKRLNPVLIWSCDDGIIYGKAYKLSGEVKLGSRPLHNEAAIDREMMVYFERQKEFKYIRFT